LFDVLLATLRTWRRRVRERRELSQMCAHDFGDLAVPPGLIRDETRRWPWQKASPRWTEIAPRRNGSFGLRPPRPSPLTSPGDAADAELRP
jgi:uncharacterized protein YjiS (DUF1127 family)